MADVDNEPFFIRIALDQEDINDVYGHYDIYYSIRLHHGGSFSPCPGRSYDGGTINFVDMIDVNKFRSHHLIEVMKKFNYSAEVPMFFHYLNPGSDLDVGLQRISNDYDMLNLARLVPSHRLFEFYCEHWKTTVPNGLVQQDVAELDYNDLNCSSKVKMVDSEESEDSDKDYSDESAEDSEGEESDEDSEGEENSNEGSGEDDNDYLVDNENNVADPEVDMSEYRMNIDLDVVEMNPKEDGQVDVLDNEVLHSGSDNEDDATGIRNNRLRYARNENENNPNFYLGQVFGTKQEAKSLIKVLTVESRRLIKIVKDDKDRVRAVCQGPLPSFKINEDGTHTESQGPSSQGKGNGTVVDKRKGKGVVVDKSKAKGGVFDKSKGKGLVVDKSKVKGVVVDKSKAKGAVGNKGKAKGPDVNVGGRGKKTNPTKYQCPWVLLISKESGSESWVVRTLISEHKCTQTRIISACTSTFLSQQMLDQVEENPEIPVRAVQEQFQRKYELGVSKSKAYRAKVKAKKQVQGDYQKQYALLRDYCNELLISNPGTSVRIEVEPIRNLNETTRIFKRMYVCLGALKQGFKALGRDLLGLDGAFMKGPFPGQILSAVGLDSNNGTYPVCYALVEAENISSWTWFLELISEDLDLETNSHFTFISDRQKGLIPAIARVFPSADHRFCLRHIYENMKATFKGQLYKDMLWKIATTTTVFQFEDAMNELKRFNNDAYLWLSKIPPKHWSRSHFSGKAVSDVLLNNMCEVFNGKIVEGRDKPIISALEYIREYLMRKIVTVLNLQEKSDGLLTPIATKVLEKTKKDASRYTVMWNGFDKYQVSGPMGNQRVVDMGQRVCACRGWEITGMPCRHVVATVWFMASNGQSPPQLENWVHPVYRMDTWRKVYSFKINPLNGRDVWPKSQVPSTLLPPKHHKQIGRPKKARKRSAVEMEDIPTSGRLSKKGGTVKCKNCGVSGHNKRSCTKKKDLKVGTKKKELKVGT